MNTSIITKVCTRCRSEKPANSEYFAKDKKGKYGLKSQCKKCNKLYRKKHYEENRETIREKQNEYLKRYYIKNKDKILEYKREYYQENKEDILAYQQNYQEKNKYKIKLYRRVYKRNNRELFNSHKQKRKALKRRLPYSLTLKQWNKIKSDFDYKCAYCGRECKLHQEHFIPLSKGGEYTVNNIIPACVHCNSSKGNKDFFEWYPTYKYFSNRRESKILKHLNYNDNREQQLALV